MLAKLSYVIQRGYLCGIATALVCCVASPVVAVAPAAGVWGNGIQRFSHGAVDGGNGFREVTLNAWIDEAGVTHGVMVWRGDVFQELPGGDIHYGGPANTYFFEVFHIDFVGDGMAWVYGVVTASPQGIGDGEVFGFLFRDNGRNGYPDELNGLPIDAGNYLVSP